MCGAEVGGSPGLCAHAEPAPPEPRLSPGFSCTVTGAEPEGGAELSVIAFSFHRTATPNSGPRLIFCRSPKGEIKKGANLHSSALPTGLLLFYPVQELPRRGLALKC